MFTSHIPIARTIITCCLLIAASACNFPSGTSANTPVSQDILFTQAAQTVIAKLTQEGPALTMTPVNPGPSSVPTTQPAETLQPVSTASPTPLSPTATFTTNPTATTSLSDPKLSLGSPTWKDVFADSKNWSLSDDDHTKMEVQDNYLVMTAKKAENWDGWTITWLTGKNFYLEMTASPGSCSGLDHYGVVFRTKDDASQAYLFGFSCDGRYSFYLWDGESFSRLIKWTESSAINQGANQTNRLGVKAEGDHFSFYANGTFLGDYQDASYTEGHIGVFIGSANTPDFTVKVAEMDFWELK